MAGLPPSYAHFTDTTRFRSTFTIAKATPTLSVSDAGGVYNGNPLPATDTASSHAASPLNDRFNFVYSLNNTLGYQQKTNTPLNASINTNANTFNKHHAYYTN